jgi:integrase
LPSGNRTCLHPARPLRPLARPLEGIEIAGRKKRGKEQLRLDELFAGLTRDGLRCWTTRLCRALDVPRVTVRGLRGTHATASMRPRANPHAVAEALGPTSFAVTARDYADP